MALDAPTIGAKKAMQRLLFVSNPSTRRLPGMAREGFVQLSFTITETGEVDDVNVIKAEPKRILSREANTAAADTWGNTGTARAVHAARHDC